jgi:hypothetical protein
MCMWSKLTWTLTHPTHPDPVTHAFFQKRARLLARFSTRWQKLPTGCLNPHPMRQAPDVTAQVGETWDHEVLSHLTFFPIKKTMKSLNFEMVLLGMCQVLECVLFLVNSMKFHVIRPTAHPFFCHGTCIYTYYRHISKTHMYLSDTQIYVDYIVVQCTICPYILYTYPLHT